MHIATYFPPPPSVDIQDPRILQSVAILIPSSSDQQLWTLLTTVEAACIMGGSLHWPRAPLSSLQFGPLLGQVTQYTYTHTMSSIMALVTSCVQFSQGTTVMMLFNVPNTLFPILKSGSNRLGRFETHQTYFLQ